MENRLKEKNKALTNCTLEEMEQEWQRTKAV
jgi:hypothetical protein